MRRCSNGPTTLYQCVRQTLRREGIRAISPILDADFDVLDHQVDTYRQWCEDVDVIPAVA